MRPALPVADEVTRQASAGTLLEVRDLTITAPGQARPVVDRLSFSLDRGKTLAVVGESGAGKSMTGLAIIGLVPPPLRVVSEELIWKGALLNDVSARERRLLRGREIGLIFQEPSAAMNPAVAVGEQVAEMLRVHRNLGRANARREAIALLDRVHIADAAGRYRAFPHEMSGGMLQRVAIAIAVACQPDLLIADEPTTALDTTVQRGVLELLAELQEESGMAMLFITHNLALVAEMADRVLVMRDGQALEQATVLDLFEKPRTIYTRRLLAAHQTP